MKFSYNWLKEVSKTKKSVEELINLVMLKGFELDERINLAANFKNFIVGEVLAVKNHPDADRLKVVSLNLGEFGQEVQIVCGASNVAVGQKVPVALPEAILPNSKIKIKKAEMRGVESNGMICAEDELGLGKDHDGIMILDDNLKVGVDLAEALNLKDEILDFDILPNRSHDCLSYQGLAREIAAMENRKIDFPSQPKAGTAKVVTAKADLKNTDYKKKGELLNIKIEERKLCPRYMGAVLKNIKLRKSPDWMQARLVASGMEPINNVVDITNYVMLETGSPLHAFDFEEVADNGKVNVVVRKAQKEEKLELLSDVDLELHEDDLIIANQNKATALAGIKGGKKSGINSNTNQIVLEAANFDLLGIRKARQRHSLATESQARFEKGISPVLTQVALERAVALLQEYAGAELIEIVDCNHFENKNQVVELDVKSIERLLGEKVDIDEVFTILENLDFAINDKEKSQVKVIVPYWRLDIEGQADFIEEIGRIKGYGNIKEQYLMTASKPSKRNLERELEWELKDCLVALGFDEVINYSFYGNQDVEIGKISGEHFELENPNSKGQNLMRKSLLSGIIQASKLNQKNFDDFCLFEIGRIYLPEKNPGEEMKIAGACFNSLLKLPELFYLTKEKIKSLVQKIANQEVEFKVLEKPTTNFLHLTRRAEILVGGKKIGELGEINPKVAKNYKTKKQFVVFELDFKILFNLQANKKLFQSIQKFPSVERDLAMFVDSKTEVAEVEKNIQKSGGAMLKEIRLFDIFEDEENNKKSFAFHLKFVKIDSTLKGEEVDEKMKEIMKALEQSGCQIRK